MLAQLVSLCFTLTLFFLGSATASTEIARVGEVSISKDDFEKYFQDNLKFYRFRLPNRNEVLDELVARKAGVIEAKRLGLEKDPQVQERVEAILFNAFVEREAGPEIEKIFITDNDAKDFYKRNPEIRTSHIFIALPPDADKQTVERDRKALEKIKKEYDKGNVSFSELAQKNSESNTANQGGDLDFQMKDRLDPNYYSIAKSLEIGQVSDPVRSTMGLHLIKLTGKRAWTETDKARVKRLAFEDKRNKLVEDTVTKIKKKLNAKVNYDLLN